MLTIDNIKEIVSRIVKKCGVRYAYLFGSYAKGTNDAILIEIILA